ncbi:histidine phosphatase family protein [Seohaeicola zhoushanensis]|uniref:Histidine phosphatase family protein n=1 Tax=Seohaeicola zhoushanensis TaxID=1569283 RepID=A0A8J3H065_9RHOB|nr:histidine phosphatase family protein [Seohaeicola zhoushanensis]GHF58609.1 histidine phosphatase family protein [Seohaeicola zhoushanensis]
MAELLVVRHGQASFGADNYDRLSEVGHEQSRLAGEALREAGWVPDRLVTGTLERQKETLRSMGFDAEPEQHPGFNEYDFHDLLHVRFAGQVPEAVKGERKTHFRTLRETILDWQKGGCAGAKESWSEFEARVAAALAFATDTSARRVLVISSGGVIGQLVAQALAAPKPMMMELNLQVKNSSMTRFVFSGPRFFLNEFNATPHLAPKDRAGLLTYS